MSEQKMIDFDLAKARRLKKAYDKAVASGAEVFDFEDHGPILVLYCKYVIEYLETQFKEKL
jgi:hypothetical protein